MLAATVDVEFAKASLLEPTTVLSLYNRHCALDPTPAAALPPTPPPAAAAAGSASLLLPLLLLPPLLLPPPLSLLGSRPPRSTAYEK